MKFGILFRPQDPPNAAHIRERWQEILQAARVAEESGFDGLFVPEHHMMEDAYLPSPWAALGALSAVTERVELGTTITLLPLEHPIHFAEHAAMADVLAGGRIRIGVGLGNFPQEFDLFGVNAKTQVSRFEECIEIVQRVWAARRSTSTASTSTSRRRSRHCRSGPSFGSARCLSRAFAEPRGSAVHGRPTRSTTST